LPATWSFVAVVKPLESRAWQGFPAIFPGKKTA